MHKPSLIREHYSIIAIQIRINSSSIYYALWSDENISNIYHNQYK